MKRSLVPLTAGALLTLASPAFADPTAADKETARTLLNDGDKQFAAGNMQDALKSYREADDIMHVPSTGVELAKAQAAAGQLVEAKESCRRVISHPASTPEPSAFVAARQRCEELSASLSSRIPSVVLKLTGIAPNVHPTVKIDGEDVRATGPELRRKMNPGEHKLVVQAPGYETAERTFSLKESESSDVEIALVAGQGTPAAATDTPAPATEPPKDAPTTRAPVPLYSWIGFGAGGVALVAGSITGGLSLGKLSGVKQHCKGDVCDPSQSSDLDTTRRLELIANISFACAIVGGGIGLYGVLTRGQTTAAAAKVEPYVTGNGAGVRGTF